MISQMTERMIILKRKFLAFCLSLAMLITMLPSTVLAAEGPTLTVSSATVKAGETGSVTVSISNNTGFDTISFQIAETEGLTIDSVDVADGIIASWYADYATETKKFSAMSGSAATTNGVICTINFTVDASASGPISVALEEDTNADGTLMLEDEAVEGVTFESGSVTVGSSAATGYTAALSTSSASNEVNGGSQITVNVGVSHSEETTFNAGEIKLSYDKSLLTLVEDSVKDYSYTDANGVLTIEDFGNDKSMSYVYGIIFNAASVTQDTETQVTLTSAAFQDKVGATTDDLEGATITNSPIEITIKVPMVNVTLTEKDTTNTTETTTEKGKDYTFAPTDTNNYTYSDVTATVGGTAVTVTPSDDGKSFTIAGVDVTGDIELIYTKTANTYDVTTRYVDETGSELSTSTAKDAAAYNTPFAFTVDSDVEAGATVGYTYTLTSVTINSENYTGYSCAQGTKDYTIRGEDISGDIVITIEKKEIPANTYTVTVDGEAAGDAAVEKSPVTQGETAKITVTVESGYTYTVTATMGGNTATVNQADNVYTVANVTGNVVFTVNKTLDTSSVAVYEYVTMDTVGSAWLVTFNPTLADGKVPTYDSNPMYWSEKYNAYCYLVIAGTQENAEADAAAKVNAGTGNKTNVDYGMDINGTNITDAADAQLVWNMYNAMYNSFDENDENAKGVAMMKFLAADQNATSDNTANWKLNVEDAQVIIDNILTGTATT